MREHLVLLTCLLVVCIGVVVPSAPVHAASVAVFDEGALLTRADGVVHAQVIADASAPPSADGLVLETRYVLSVRQVFRGRTGAMETLVLPGSPTDHPRGVRISGVPRLLPGMDVLLAFERRDDGGLAPQHLGLGVYVGGHADGARVWRRTLSMHTAHGDRDVHDAALLERWLIDAAMGKRRSLDSLRDVDPMRLNGWAKFTLVLDPGSGRPLRWFEFDGGGEVGWHAVIGGQSGWSGSLAAVPAALAAWRDDPGSAIGVVDAGTVDDDAGISAMDGRNAVVWNDPQGVIGGSFDCAAGGVLAVGGSFYDTDLAAGPGGSFHRALEGFVIVQDGAACYLSADGGRHGAEVLTHEIGHALGFGHSCGDAQSPACAGQPVFAAATMRASAHGDGRGAAIRDDDRAAAAAVYPSNESAPMLFADGFEE